MAKKLRLFVVVLVMLLSASACGRDSGTQTGPGPIPSGSPNVSVISGATSQPVVGASIVYKSKTYSTNADGKAQVPEYGDGMIEISASGFLPRKAPVDPSGVYNLVPSDKSGLLYSGRIHDVKECAGRTCRPVKNVDVVLSSISDAEALAVYDKAVAFLEPATKGKLKLIKAGSFSNPQHLSVPVMIIPSLPTLGVGGPLTVTSSGEITIGTSIQARDIALMRDYDAVLHALSEVMGLSRAPASQEDLGIFRVLLSRSVGNKWEDTDPGWR